MLSLAAVQSTALLAPVAPMRGSALRMTAEVETPVGGQTWAISKDHSPGDFGWDPLGLKPTDAKELAEMQTKELNNGRLAMFGIAGMVAQELVSGSKLF